MLFKWKDNFSCNVKEIDEQHRKLFELGSKLYDMATLDDGYDHYDEMVKVLDELREYTVYHFSYEEKLMVDNGYKDYDIHKIEHDFFIKKIKRLEAKDLDADQKQAVMEMIKFVADWVASHILKTDMQYKDFFNQKGIK